MIHCFSELQKSHNVHWISRTDTTSSIEIRITCALIRHSHDFFPLRLSATGSHLESGTRVRRLERLLTNTLISNFNISFFQFCAHSAHSTSSKRLKGILIERVSCPIRTAREDPRMRMTYHPLPALRNLYELNLYFALIPMPLWLIKHQRIESMYTRTDPITGNVGRIRKKDVESPIVSLSLN